MSIRPLMRAEREASGRRVGGRFRPERRVDVVDSLHLKHRRSERPIRQNWKDFKVAAGVFGREQKLATFVNADMSRSAHGRLSIQERQIAGEPVDPIGAHGSWWPVFISRIQVCPRRIESNRRWTRCR